MAYVKKTTDERRQQISDALQRIENGVRDAFASSDHLRDFLKLHHKFHAYSIGNQLLIYCQKPDATAVAGYTAWKELGRQVKKGEKGLMIIAPTTYTVELENEKGEKIKEPRVSYRSAYVFDASQTEGEPLPKVEMHTVSGDSLEAAAFIRTIESISECKIEYRSVFEDVTLANGADGYYSKTQNIIVVRDDLDVNNKASVLAHEFAHSILHSDRHLSKDKNQKEIEAEGVAFVIMDHYGCDTQLASTDYIVQYAANKSSKELKEILHNINEEASIMIERIDAEFPTMLEQAKAEDKYLTNAEIVKILPSTVKEIMDRFGDRLENDVWYLDEDAGEVHWIYYNPDSVAGGQFVENIFGYDDIRELQEVEDADTFFDVIGSNCKQYLYDIDTEDFRDMARHLLIDAPQLEGCDGSVMEALKQTSEDHYRKLEEKLQKQNEEIDAVVSVLRQMHMDEYSLTYFNDQIVAVDRENNRLIGKELYEFILNEAMALDDKFQPVGQDIDQQSIDKLIALASKYNAEIRTVNANGASLTINTIDLPVEEHEQESIDLTVPGAIDPDDPDYIAVRGTQKREGYIQDEYGEKIGASRRDLANVNITREIFDTLNSSERIQFTNKNSVWHTPNYKDLIEAGLPRTVARFIRDVRTSIPSGPVLSKYRKYSDEQLLEEQQKYVSFVSEVRQDMETLKTEADVEKYFSDVVCGKYFERTGTYMVKTKPEYLNLANSRFCHAAQTKISTLNREINEKNWCLSDREIALKNCRVLQAGADDVNITFDDSKDNHRLCIEVTNPSGICRRYRIDIDDNPFKDGDFILINGYTVFSQPFVSKEDAENYLVEKYANEKEASKDQSASDRKKKFKPSMNLNCTDRTGPDPEITDVTPQQLVTAFNLHGIEFGNYVNESDRRISIDKCYGALKDLASALDIPPQALSMGGNLSIAFGARGRGGNAAAHYEPGRDVINLTKNNGCGQLAHEYGHGISNIVGRHVAGVALMDSNHDTALMLKNALFEKELSPEEKELEFHKPRRECIESTMQKFDEEFEHHLNDPTIQTTRSELMNALTASHSTENILDTQFIVRYYPISNNAIALFERKDVASNEIMRLMKDAYIATGMSPSTSFLSDVLIAQHTCAYLHQQEQIKRKKTQYLDNSEKFDALFSKESGYWASREEMFARAFACYIEDKLAEKGINNRYLTGHADSAITVTKDREGNDVRIAAFPQGEERKAINQAFDHFFETIREKMLEMDQEHQKEKQKKREQYRASKEPSI